MSHPRPFTGFVLRNISATAEKESILDIGCGIGFYGYFIRRKKRKNDYIVGIDIYKPYLNLAKRKHVYDDLVLCDASKLAFKADSFNLVLAAQLIEHLPKHKGMELLTDIERICKGRSIITTPNGYCPWGEDSLIESNIHRSQWYVKDFLLRKYRVRGLGLKLVKSFEKHVYLWIFLSLSFTPLSYVFPNVAGFLIATKNIKE